MQFGIQTVKLIANTEIEIDPAFSIFWKRIISEDENAKVRWIIRNPHKWRKYKKGYVKLNNDVAFNCSLDRRLFLKLESKCNTAQLIFDRQALLPMVSERGKDVFVRICLPQI